MANMLVNITNSYDKPDKTEEREAMEKLGTRTVAIRDIELTRNVIVQARWLARIFPNRTPRMPMNLSSSGV